MKPRILVVDDDAAVRRMLRDLLTTAGYDVVSAGTFEDAKLSADAADPALILLDIRLGDYNGLQLLLHERLNHPGRPIIVMTGHPDSVLEAEARRAGAEFIEKPIQTTRLIAMIGRLLSSEGRREDPR
jgi:DNA-binding NtrC family response regulator